MAPAPTATANRPLGKPSKIRYFKGKAPEAAVDSDSDEDDDEEDLKPPEPVHRVDKNVVAGGAGRIIPEGGKMKVALRDVKIEGGRVVLPKAAKEEESEEESEDEEEEDVRPRVGIPKPPGSEESSEYETDSEEESEEEKKPAFRPVFVRKDARGMTQEKLAAEAEAKAKAEEEMQVQRKLDSKDLAGETIRRELAEREATDIQPDIDDTDGLDPAAEFDAWRARELARLLRDKQAQAERDLEKEEIERRRAMPEEQRLREDMEFAAKTREKEKGQMGFLQKYYHKGAFHQDDDLLKRDYTGATESAVDMSMLPKVMQVRDFGKMSRTKYTHLVDQDTSQGGWGAAPRATAPGGQEGPGQFAQGCWNCGGPHLRKDCPNDNPNDPLKGLGTSANTSSLGGGGPSGRGWGGDKPRDYGGERDRERGDRYRDEGRERRFEEVRRDDRRGGDGDRERDHGGERDERRDRDRDDRKRHRSRSRSPGRRDEKRRDDRDRDRRRDGGDRDRDRDRRRYD